MHKHLLCLLLSCTFLLPASKAQLISYEKIESYSTDQIRNLARSFSVPNGLINFEYAIDTYKILYNTVGPNGDTVLASGAYLVPVNTTCSLPTITYQHGTTTRKSNVPSRRNAEYSINLFYATGGYFVSLPDYIGLGDSPGLHPYVHSDSEANSVIDLLRAGKEMVAELEAKQSDDLFLFGYSQGGHATAAAHKKIQEELSDEFTIAASNPMAGPYDLAGAQTDVILLDEPYPTPAYLPYFILAYLEIYPDLLPFTVDEVFAAPYNTSLPPLFDGSLSLDQIGAQMPAVPNQILTTSFLDSFKLNLDHPMRIALARNALLDWAPSAPTRLTHCMGDDQVPFENSVVAKSSFESNGATQVELLDLGNSDHVDCARLALISGIAYFNRFYVGDNGIALADTTIVKATDLNSMDGSITVSISGGSGDISYLWSTGETTASISGLAAGTYTVTVSDPDACSKEFSFELEALNTTGTGDPSL
ncbi:MAG: lipase family protein, partial [Bacteroidota bacterium]